MKEAEVLDRQIGKYNTDTIPVVLTPAQVSRVKDIEEEVNEYLDEQDETQIKILYGNRIYPKVKKIDTYKRVTRVKLKGVYIDPAGKSFPQLYIWQYYADGNSYHNY